MGSSAFQPRCLALRLICASQVDQTIFSAVLPVPLPEGDYSVSVDLTDPDTGATSALEDIPVTASAPEEVSPLTVQHVSVVPMPDPTTIVFVQVQIVIANTGPLISGGEVTLVVYRDGEPVDEAVLASSMTICTCASSMENRPK